MAQTTNGIVNPRTSTAIEFVVRPREDLFLRGGIRTIPRVTAGEGYPCQMQKNQTFSCLFRHYAKHNGLRKEDLVFYFVNELSPDEMPETVHLMPFDEVWVEHKKIEGEVVRNAVKYDTYSSSFRALLKSEEHSDITFLVGLDGEEKESVSAHKAILTARCEYFRAMFRAGGLSESLRNTVELSYDPSSFRRVLEYIYTNDVAMLDTCSTQEITSLLALSNEFLLPDLTQLCETAAAKYLSMDNIGAYMLVCDKYDTPILRNACHNYVTNNISTLKLEESFRREVADNPELALLLVDAIPDQDYCSKKRRTSSNDSSSLMPHTAIGGGGMLVNAPPNTILNPIWPLTQTTHPFIQYDV